MRFDYEKDRRMTFKVGGGIIEMKFFLGDTPEEPVRAYHEYINKFALLPFWSFGIHLCRWGWQSSRDWQNVWMKANEYKFPFDTLWSDIDYMFKYENFGIDTSRYNVQDMKRVTDISTPLGVHWVPIIDAGIGINSPFARIGNEMGIFIKSGKFPGRNLLGRVWPGDVHFVDFNHPKAIEYWTRGLNNIKEPPLNGPAPSGIWIDMNELSNFVSGEISQNVADSHEDEIFQQIWSPTKGGYRDKSISHSAQHYNKEDGQYFHLKRKQLTEYELHNLEGFLEGIATNVALKKQGKQLPFILSRSTMFGQGKYTTHWTGDNVANWEFLQLSVAEIFNF